MYNPLYEIHLARTQAPDKSCQTCYDFADARQVFAGPTMTVEDAREYGEQRFNTTGFLGTAIVTITHPETDDEIHIISMRKAESDEIETLSRYL